MPPYPTILGICNSLLSFLMLYGNQRYEGVDVIYTQVNKLVVVYDIARFERNKQALQNLIFLNFLFFPIVFFYRFWDFIYRF